MLRNKTLAELNYIVSNGQENYLKTIDNINKYFVSLINPKNLDSNSKDNVVIKYSVDFEKLCVSLMAHGSPDPSEMTLFRFYAALSYFEDRNRKQHGTNGKNQ
jgi:hypothetical protein